MDIKKRKPAEPVPSELISWGEFIQLAAVHPSLVGELIDLGWLQPLRTGQEDYLFRITDVYRLRKHVRLCEDFELSTLGGTIVVDLLSRIEDLESRVKELEGLLSEK